MNIQDIEAGKSYACEFKVKTFVDTDGTPIDTRNIQIGQKVSGMPGEYQGFGVIQIRDTQNQLVEIWDTKFSREWTVAWTDCWNVDVVEWEDD